MSSINKILWLDLETKSTTDLAKSGVYRYAESPETEITLFGYAINDNPASVWDLTAGDPMPTDLRKVVDDPEYTFIAHNANFDRVMLATKLGKPFDDLSRWWDSMVQAYTCALPGALGTLSEVLGLPIDKAKDKDGRRLVLKFCKPTKDGVWHNRETDPDDWAKFVNYCRLDVEAMREVIKRVPAWNRTKALRDDWITDQRINDRGFPIDVELVNAAVEAAKQVKEDSNAEIVERTDGAIQTTGQRDEFLKFALAQFGVTLPDMQKATLERRLNDDSLPTELRELIALRLEASKTSVQKFVSLKNAVCSDGRVRGTLQFYGAARTGRFSGRIFQPQNLPRGTMKQPQVEESIELLKSGLAPVLSDNVNTMISNCIRGAICAPEGKKLVVADLSNIEGRMLAWLAGEEWKIKAFIDYDEGNGPDLYKATYGRTFGVSPDEVTKQQRQIGKVLELGLGYSGGVGAFLTFSRAYGVDLDDLADITYRELDKQFLKEAEGAYDFFVEKKMTHGLKRHTFIACEAIKRAWRFAHPNIVRFWKEMDEVTEAVVSGAVKSGMVGEYIKVCSPASGWLALVLPSRRALIYPACRLPATNEHCTFTYAGMNQYSRKWDRIRTYSGKLTENVTQAAARDILMAGIKNAEANNYSVIMHVHDEIIAEVPDDPSFNADGLAKCMTDAPAWAEGLPLSAAGFEAKRYRKD